MCVFVMCVCVFVMCVCAHLFLHACAGSDDSVHQGHLTYKDTHSLWLLKNMLAIYIEYIPSTLQVPHHKTVTVLLQSS